MRNNAYSRLLFLVVALCVSILTACSGRKLPSAKEFPRVRTITVTAVSENADVDREAIDHFREVFEAELGGKGYEVCTTPCDPDARVTVDVHDYDPPEASFDVSARSRDGDLFFNLPAPRREERALVVRVSKFWPWRPGKVLLLPPRDVVQGGEFHAKSGGTGKLFMETFEFELTGRTPLTFARTSNPAFDNETIASPEEARREATRLGADYYMQFVLGEFRNSAPMTFRNDYVILDSASMYRVDNGEIVWNLPTPFAIGGNNLRGRDHLIVTIAKRSAARFLGGHSNHAHGSRVQVAKPTVGANASARSQSQARGAEAGQQKVVSPEDKLENLRFLLEQGLITKEEYQRKRQEVLNEL